MKVIYLLTSMTFISISSFAQVQLFPIKPKYKIDFLHKDMPVFLHRDMTVQKMGLITFSKATLTGGNATGKIYRLPLDNMPCLVADTRLLSPIPNAGMRGFQQSLMLTPYKQEDIIPVQ